MGNLIRTFTKGRGRGGDPGESLVKIVSDPGSKTGDRPASNPFETTRCACFVI